MGVQETTVIGRPAVTGLCILVLVAAPLVYLYPNRQLASIGPFKPFMWTNVVRNNTLPVPGGGSSSSSSSSNASTPGNSSSQPHLSPSRGPTGSNTTSPIMQTTWKQLSDAVIAAGVPSNIQALTAASPNVTEACLSLLQQAYRAHSCVKPETEHNLDVLLCTAAGNFRGTLLIYDVRAGQQMSAGQPGMQQQQAENTTGAQGSAHNVYRLRLSGPEVVQPAVHYCGRVAAAQFQLTRSGSFHLQVLQLYEDFSYHNPPLVRSHIHIARHQLQVNVGLSAAARAGTVASTPDCQLDTVWGSDSNHGLQSSHNHHNSSSSSSAAPTSTANASTTTSTKSVSTLDTLQPRSSTAHNMNSSSSCPVCTSLSPEGRWVAAPSAPPELLANVQSALQHTCVFRNTKPPLPYYGCPLALQNASTPDIEEHPVLEWVPYSCRYRKITPSFADQCKSTLLPRVEQQLPQRTVCFIGDSQTRHLYNQVVHLLEGPAAGYRTQVSGFGRAYQVLKSKVLRYVADNYGNNTALRLDTGFCSHVFINFGQWPVSHAEERPWDAQRYAQAVHRLALSMQAQQRKHNNKQYWLTSGPLPLNDYQQERIAYIGRAVDYRTDPFLLLFNKVAATIMHAHGIPVIDTYSIASPLFDLSYDGGHFIGTVGLAQATMVANTFCNDLLRSNMTRTVAAAT